MRTRTQEQRKETSSSHRQGKALSAETFTFLHQQVVVSNTPYLFQEYVIIFMQIWCFVSMLYIYIYIYRYRYTYFFILDVYLFVFSYYYQNLVHGWTLILFYLLIVIYLRNLTLWNTCSFLIILLPAIILARHLLIVFLFNAISTIILTKYIF